MACYTPSLLTSTYPTTANLIDLYELEGLSTGFDYLTGVDDPAVFATENGFFGTLTDQGFFTGCVVKKYYTPEQALVLYAQSYTYETLTINGIEYKMRTEGIFTGEFNAGMSCYSAGEDPCNILNTLSTEGFTTGCPELITDADPALVDNQCTDGRCYGSGCMAPWNDTDTITSAGPVADWTDSAVTTDIDLGCPITLFAFGNMEAHLSVRMYVDGVLATQFDSGGGVNGHVSAIVLMTTGPHTISYKWYVDTADSPTGTICMLAFKQSCS